MITNITTNNAYPYLTVNAGVGPYISPGAQSAGMMRFNTSSNQIEVYDGASWRQISGTATIDLTQHTLEIFRWAEKRMEEDQRIQQLIRENPAVADAFQNYQDAADKLKVVVALTQQEKNK